MCRVRPVALLGLGVWLAVTGCADRVLGPVRAALIRADSLAARVAEEVSPEDVASYEIDVSGAAVSFACAAYRATVRFGRPFGITSLRLPDQPVDFAHSTLPLADWEWFWFDRGGRRISAKLVDPDWGSPALEELPDQVILRFSQRGVPEPGIELSVEYRLGAQGAEFEVQYMVDNHTGRQLASPYVMVGFPGFANHGWVSEVATAVDRRVPTPPHTTFLAEALADGRSEYLLLRHDVDPRVSRQALQGAIVVDAAGHRYALQASCVPGTGVEQAYSAHTNKPGYLTSHLYVFLKDMEDGESRQVLVRYVVRRSP